MPFSVASTRRFATPLVLLGGLSTLATGCEGGKSTDGTSGIEEQEGLTFSPPEAGRGTTVDARITSGTSVFDFSGDTTLDLGQGVTVNSVTVLDGWTASANISVGDSADLGARDALIGAAAGDLTIAGALTVTDDSFTISPDRGLIGETVQVEMFGHNTEWSGGDTWAWFGDGIEVTGVTVLSETDLIADVSIARDAVPGLRDVSVDQGSDVTTLYSGFQVDRVSMSATFDPPEASQGDTVSFTVEGIGTHFDDASAMEFWKSGDQKGDIIIDSIHVVDAEHINGTMTLSNAAETGLRDVLTRTDSEGVLMEDALNVIDAAADLSDVGISLAFNVTRGIDNTTGAISEYVTGQAVFYIPLDPPCGAGSSGDGPSPYDVNGVFEVPDPVDQPDCPNNDTVGAGEHVWFESDCNVVTLDRQVDASSGMIYYTAELTMDDYCPGMYGADAYDLHTEGEEGGIGEYILEAVQPSVPADWELLTPELWGNYTWNRAEDFLYTWTPAQTYPDAIFSTGISGTLVSTGKSGFAGSLPWDDGEHTYTSAELSELEAGNVSFYAYSYIEGPEFGFPFSTIQDNKSNSYIYLSGSMVLE